MSARTIAWRDVVDARAGSLGPLCLGMGVLFAFVGFAASRSPAPTTELLTAAALAIGPYAAIVVAHESVAAERTNGTIRLALTLPHRRRDVVLGHFLGRWVVLSAMLAVGFVGGIAGAFMNGKATDLLLLAPVVPVSLLLTGTFTGIAVGISASTDSTTLSFVGGLLGAAICLGWSDVPGALRYVIAGFSSPSGPQPAWAEAMVLFDPLPAVADLLGVLSDSAAADATAGPADALVGLAVLLVWLAAPLAVGVRRFGRAEL